MKLELQFVGSEAVPARVLAKLIQDINKSLLEEEKECVATIRREFSEIPQVAVDAALYRLREYERKGFSALEIESVEYGCIIISAVVIAVAHWILDKTIGETLKDAYRGTQLEKSLKRFLLIGQKERLKKALNKVSRKSRKYVVKSSKKPPKPDVAIIVDVQEHEPSSGQHKLIVKIECWREPGDPISYVKLADEYNAEIEGKRSNLGKRPVDD